MKKLFWIAIAIIFIGCEKDGAKLECEINNTFLFELTNGSNDTYAIYVNNIYQTDIKGKKKQTLTLPAGFIKITVKQKDGYLLYPTVKDYEYTLNSCERYYLVFP